MYCLAVRTPGDPSVRSISGIRHAGGNRKPSVWGAITAIVTCTIRYSAKILTSRGVCQCFGEARGQKLQNGDHMHQALRQSCMCSTQHLFFFFFLCDSDIDSYYKIHTISPRVWSFAILCMAMLSQVDNTPTGFCVVVADTYRSKKGFACDKLCTFGNRCQLLNMKVSSTHNIFIFVLQGDKGTLSTLVPEPDFQEMCMLGTAIPETTADACSRLTDQYTKPIFNFPSWLERHRQNLLYKYAMRRAFIYKISAGMRALMASLNYLT